ncbi:Down syndrome cell adhesion molecule-like protein Dscam2 [Eumeta japonica]|uniref:Down syndrome cell adhesion molecule-like protein Dscam2 n=1 Tax=Eumeta variegata TaxID=151549 RepID=A0A4C1SDE1_EUMVA|nr:Down syndrome cell adhesion molecule-like protein Dscam2 [Eumeta japonica]
MTYTPKSRAATADGAAFRQASFRQSAGGGGRARRRGLKQTHNSGGLTRAICSEASSQVHRVQRRPARPRGPARAMSRALALSLYLLLRREYARRPPPSALSSPPRFLVGFSFLLLCPGRGRADITRRRIMFLAVVNRQTKQTRRFIRLTNEETINTAHAYLLQLSFTRAELSQLGPSFVLEPPSLVQYPTSSGTKVACVARGDPAPGISWLGDDGALINDIAGVRRIHKNGTLDILPGSGYREPQQQPPTAAAANAHGSVLSRDVTLQPGTVIANVMTPLIGHGLSRSLNDR